MSDVKKYKRNLKIYSFHNLALSFVPHFLIAVFYNEALLGSYAWAMSVFSVVLLSTAVSEIPLGILSDLVGRKTTMILGAFTRFLGYGFYLIPSFYPETAFVLIFTGAVFIGFSEALFSGTTEAIVYESAKNLGREGRYKKYYSRGNGIAYLTQALSALIAGFIAYQYGYQLCYILTLIGSIVLVYVNFFWTDVRILEKDKVRVKVIVKHVYDCLYLFKSNKKLRYLGYAQALVENMSARFEVIYFKLFLPEYLLGIPRTLKLFFGTLSFAFSSKIIDKFNPIRTIIYANTGMIVARASGVILNSICSPFLMAAVDFFGPVSRTAKNMLLHQELTNQQRATMTSIISMFTTVWTAILISLLGYLLDLTSVRFVLGVLVFYRIAALYIYKQIEKMDRDSLKS